MGDIKGISLNIISDVCKKVEYLVLTDDFKLVKAEIKGLSCEATFKYRNKLDPGMNIDITYNIPKHFAEDRSSLNTIKNIESICRAIKITSGYIIDELSIKKNIIKSTFFNHNDNTIIKVKVPREYF